MKRSKPTSVPKIELSAEKKAELDRELQWCIDHLELGLQRKDADEYQIKETRKVITTLRSNAPDVKKRQLMKVVFGDYRKLMKIETQMEEQRRLEEEQKKTSNVEPSSSSVGETNETNTTTPSETKQ